TRLSLVTSGGTEVLRVTDTANTLNGINHFAWPVPHGVTGNDLRLRVTVLQTQPQAIGGGNPTDDSDGNNTFEDHVLFPVINVVSPNGGDVLANGQVVDVQWAMAGVVSTAP